MFRKFSAALVLITAFAAVNNCNAQGWLKKATGIRTPEPIRKIAPNGLKVFPGDTNNTSQLAVGTPASIDPNGTVWSGTSSPRDTNMRVGQATRWEYKSNRAFWVYNYKGRELRGRAPKHDKHEQLGKSVAGVPTNNTGGKIEVESATTSARIDINSQTGQVVRRVFRNGVQQSAKAVGQAAMQRTQDGRDLWVYGSQSVLATRGSSNPVAPQQQSNEQQIVSGVLQIIQGAIQNSNP